MQTSFCNLALAVKKLAVVITHPIQYYVPVFKLLAEQCELKVFYTWGKKGVQEKYDPDFGKTIAWDLPLLDGYHYELLENIAEDPGSHHAEGIINPDIIPRINAFAPTAILIYGYLYRSHFKVMRHFKGKIPIWFRGDSTLLDNQSNIKAIAKKLYLKWVYSYVDKAFYVGTNNKAYFKKYGLKDKKLIFAPHAVDNNRFSKKKDSDVEEIRSGFGISENDVLILFAGKLEPKKNPMLLLEAFIELRKEQGTRNRDLITTHLLFVGNGLLEKSLKQRAQSEQSGMRNIHFMDFQNQTQMPTIYQACDLFCLPSQGPGETWGLAVNEAMAAGKAVLVADKVGCAIDLVKEGINGYIFKSDDPQDLKEKLQHLVSEPHRIAIFGNQSKKGIEEWNFVQQATQFLDALGKL